MILRAFAPLLALTLLVSLLRADDDTPVFIVKNDLIASPAAPGSSAPQLVNAPDGTIYLSWLEPAPARRTALRFARFDATTHTWNSHLTISDTLAESAFPRSVITTQGQIQTTWTGTDRRHPSPTNLRIALVALADGTCLSTQISRSDNDATLLAGIIGAIPQGSSVVPVDTSVDPDSTPALAAFPDGSALVVYVKRAPDGLRSLFTARFVNGHWQAPVAMGADSWTPKPGDDCNPVIAVRGIHLAVAWFSTNGGARVNVSTSDNAGAQWLIPNRVDDIAPLGFPGLVLFDDGSLLVSWVERTATGQVILIRRISARGSLSVPVQIGRTVDGATPTLIRVKDGDATPAQILITTLNPPPANSGLSTLNPQLSTSSFLTTRLITLPSAAELAATDPCNCDPRPEDVRGYPIKGRIVSIDAAHGTLELEHTAILGVLKAGTTTVQAGPELLRAVQPGRTLLARIERTGPDWTLFNASMLKSADK
jgi:hypothetical protein